MTDIFRSDIREGKSGTALALTVKVVNVNAGCAPVANANVEVWHCDSSGNYSEYGTQTTQNYLRGIQTTNSNGEVTFTTIYPGWYQGRATHIHLEVSTGGVSRKITQIAFPESINNTVYRTGVYASRGSNPTSNPSTLSRAPALSARSVGVGSLAALVRLSNGRQRDRATLDGTSARPVLLPLCPFRSEGDPRSRSGEDVRRSQGGRPHLVRRARG